MSVAPEDTVYHLGDVALGLAHVKRVLPQLNGKKILIVGNHDLMFPSFSKRKGQKFVDKMRQEYLDAGFSDILPSGSLFTFEDMWNSPTTVRLSHFPTKNSDDPYHNGKYSNERPVDDGTINLCGHIHNSWLKNGNNINVGVDVWNFKPVPASMVLMLADRYKRKNLQAPYRTRIAIWKLIHNVKYQFRKILDLLHIH
jgi:calcineurin-like phosphoesterase family protein